MLKRIYSCFAWEAVSRRLPNLYRSKHIHSVHGARTIHLIDNQRVNFTCCSTSLIVKMPQQNRWRKT